MPNFQIIIGFLLCGTLCVLNGCATANTEELRLGHANGQDMTVAERVESGQILLYVLDDLYNDYGVPGERNIGEKKEKGSPRTCKMLVNDLYMKVEYGGDYFWMHVDTTEISIDTSGTSKPEIKGDIVYNGDEDKIVIETTGAIMLRIKDLEYIPGTWDQSSNMDSGTVYAYCNPRHIILNDESTQSPNSDDTCTCIVYKWNESLLSKDTAYSIECDRILKNSE